MSDIGLPSEMRPKYRLVTFGTLALQGPDGVPVLGTHGHHRKRLALLAVLAAAGDRGKTRDQLLLLFWPEATQSRARHSLEQLLYALRGSIDDAVFAGANPVRLNPAVVATDVGQFAAAIEKGDLETAVASYQGGFLDGFYADDAPEFEQWAESERARLRAACAQSLERLAERAEARDDHPNAVRLWRRLTELDAVSSKNAIGLIRALMHAGDHAAALQHAERYEALIATELGARVGPAVASLVAEVRATAKTEPLAMPRGQPTTPLTPNVDISADSTYFASTPTRARRRVVPYVLASLAIAAVAIATAAWPHGKAGDGTTREGTSIAVLPSANVSADPRDATIIDGLNEELITALWKIGNLRVVARTSAFAFRNSPLGVRQIGDSLGVAHVLESSFQKDSARVRVQVRLVDTRSGITRWSETYQRSLGDIFAAQSEIAAAVARQLDLRLVAGAQQRLQRGPTRNIAAYELYVAGRDLVYMRTDSGPAVGLKLLQQAVALDTGFAAAFATMPYMYFTLSGRALDEDSARVIKRLAVAAAQRALTLDPSLPEAYRGLSVALAMAPSDFRGTEAALRRALELGGAPRVREHLSRVLMWSGRHAESLIEAMRAEQEDPLSATAAADVGEALCVNGRIDEGMAQLRRLDSVEPPVRRVRGFTALCYAMKGMWLQAVEVLRGVEVANADPYSPLFGYALGRAGGTPEAEQLRAKAIAHWQKTKRGAYWVALIAAGLGDHDQAFEWLDRVGDDLVGSSSIMYPIFGALHADARFERHRARRGLRSQ
ncbi:MAG TPA: BTAD domain-containing putative transcriptional regulator [Gemmatimonadaceae bacterium]|nr:BTAD domain-containing putative transcriptional regulator [Gemmatimonadaceae bacterium]